MLNKLRELRDKFRNSRPEYSRRQWYFKALMLFISAIGFEVFGAKIYNIETDKYYGRILNYGPDYLYFMWAEGLFLALALWRLLELYWWAKNRAQDLPAGS